MAIDLESFFKVLPDGVLITDSGFCIRFVNPVFAKIVRREPADLLGQKCHHVFADRLCHTMACPLVVVQSSGVVQRFERGNYCKIHGGHSRPVITAPVYDPQGHFQGMIESVAGPDSWAHLKPERLVHDGMRKIMGAVIQAMSTTIEKRDPYTAGHQRRTAKLCRAIATVMAFTWDRIQGLRMAAAIHDLGKIHVPSAILNKPGPMSEHEMAIIRMHPRTAYDILKGIQFPWPLAETIYQHHERLDGSGYPRGLKGEQILLEARILTVADVVESMVSFRPYRQSLDLNQAIEELRRYKGARYDPHVVDICIDLLVNKGFDFQTKAWQRPAVDGRVGQESEKT